MLLRWALVAILTAATSSVAIADPITASFEVQVWYRYSYATNVEHLFMPEPFMLTMTFDSAVTRSDTRPDYSSQAYGAPVFSSIPLDAPTRPVDRPLTDYAFGYQQWRVEGDEGSAGPFEHYGLAQAGTETNLSVDPRAEYRNGLLLTMIRGGLMDPPPLSAAEFVNFIGYPDETAGFPPHLVGSELNFIFFASDFTFGAAGGRFDPSSYAYYGVARITSNLVPEPATLALVALGLAALGARRWRQRKAS